MNAFLKCSKGGNIIKVNNPKHPKSLHQQGCAPNLCNLPLDICQAVPLNTVP